MEVPLFIGEIPVTILSNSPGGARIETRIPDWMSNNLAGKENKMTGATLF